jgi:hypothetical protein
LDRKAEEMMPMKIGDVDIGKFTSALNGHLNNLFDCFGRYLKDA